MIISWHLMDDIERKKMLENQGRKRVRLKSFSARWFILLRNIGSLFKHPRRSFREICFAVHYTMGHKEETLCYSRPEGGCRKAEKIFLIAPPCSGKSYFVRKNGGRYKKFRVVDESELVGNSYNPDMSEEENLACHDQQRISFLRHSDGPVCLISTLLGLKDLAYYEGITLAAVLVPKWRVIKYWIMRRPFGYYKWSDLRNIVSYWREVKNISEKSNIPIYASFSECLNYFL